MGQDPEKKVNFLPFHAINEFMTNEYRLEVVRSTLSALPRLPESVHEPIDRAIRKNVKIAGFRNSAKAPLALKLRPVAEAFEKSPTMVATILSAWADAHSDLRARIFDLLTNREWEMLPVEADRTRLPGFLTVWPGGQDFDTLNDVYNQTYPDFPAEKNDVSLMCVWLSNRLPYQFSDETTEESAQQKTE